MHSITVLLRNVLALTWIEILAQCGLVAVFVYSGIDKLLHFQAAQSEFAAVGLNPTALFVAATIILQLGASIALFSRRYAMWGALLLAAFTVLVTLLAHRFWQAPPAAYVGELNAFLEHLGLIGGFLLVAHLAVTRNNGRPT
jgi:uncharacterized membrane protein YphA (DoxX/SURF4 family)